jgi:hypothetical protein
MIITNSPPGESQSEYESSELDALLAEQPDVQQTLDQLVSEAVRTTFADAAALVLLTDGVAVAASASAGPATMAEGWQDEYDEGPFHASLLSRGDQAGQTRTDARWPRWGPRVADLGLLSLVSKWLRVSNQTQGVLELYSTATGPAPKASLDVAEFFARYAAAALAAALERGSLVSAAQNRRTIGIAEGILMERHGIQPSAAFDRLRERGADDHTTLLVAAEAIAVEAAD